jgi:hypothetical protein
MHDTRGELRYAAGELRYAWSRGGLQVGPVRDDKLAPSQPPSLPLRSAVGSCRCTGGGGVLAARARRSAGTSEVLLGAAAFSNAASDAVSSCLSQACSLEALIIWGGGPAAGAAGGRAARAEWERLPPAAQHHRPAILGHTAQPRATSGRWRRRWNTLRPCRWRG